MRPPLRPLSANSVVATAMMSLMVRAGLFVRVVRVVRDLIKARGD